ncbi:MAG: HD domain-containing protein [Pseudomonadota bacterium]
MDDRVTEIAQTIANAGGRALVVGGYVRDHLIGIESKDIDIEVFGMDLDRLESTLEAFGEVFAAGRSFGVLRLKSLDVDFSLPRRDNKVGLGHRGFSVDIDPTLDFETAARRRDFTVNSIALDPLTGDIIDPHNGAHDLVDRRLRITDPDHFAEDPLRGLRAAQFIARFELTPDNDTVELCANLDLNELATERVGQEIYKLLLLGRRPSLGFEFLNQTGLIRFFPEMDALRGVPQDPQWHPEGDVWVHTMMVIDEAARLRRGDEDDLALMLGALCHDLGKPGTTEVIDHRVRSPGHDEAGVEPTGQFLSRLHTAHQTIGQVEALVRHHLAPALFVKQGTGPKGYRRLARKLEKSGVSIDLLVRVATADHFGRTTEEALERRFPAREIFIRENESYLFEGRAAKRVVTGQHLLARGVESGPAMGKLLALCELVQDETGWNDAEKIIEQALLRHGADDLGESEVRS